MTIILKYLHILTENIMYIGFMVLLFLSVMLFVGSLIFFLQRRSFMADRLTAIMPAKKKLGAKSGQLLLQKGPQSIFEKLSSKVHTIIAPTELATKKRLQLMMIQAGFHSEQAYHNFLAAKLLCAFLFTFGYLIKSAYYQFSVQAWAIAFICAVIGYNMPNFVIIQLRDQRKGRLTRGLPDALDLMVVCVTAGLGLDMTLKRVADETKKLNTDLSHEFLLTNLEIRAGLPREESYKNMTMRTGVPEIHNLMTILLQTSRFGTSVADTLRIHADAMRIKRRQLAEEKAAKSAVKLLIPLILFIFPALLIVLVGPAGIRIVRTLFPAISGG